MNYLNKDDQNLTIEQMKTIVRLTCQELGVIPSTIKRKEIVAKHGRAYFERMIESGRVRFSKRGGKSAQIEVNRDDYMEYAVSHYIQT